MANKGMMAEDGCSFLFMCPGCGYAHQVWVKSNPLRNNGNHPVWGWNGSMEKPTFTPSLLCNGSMKSEEVREGYQRCHSFITDGKIHFLCDCSHELVNKTVEMKDWEETIHDPTE